MRLGNNNLTQISVYEQTVCTQLLGQKNCTVIGTSDLSSELQLGQVKLKVMSKSGEFCLINFLNSILSLDKSSVSTNFLMNTLSVLPSIDVITCFNLVVISAL